MKSIETLMQEIKEEGEKNVKKSDRFLDTLLILEKAINKSIETIRIAKEELTRSMNQDDIKERDGKSL